MNFHKCPPQRVFIFALWGSLGVALLIVSLIMLSQRDTKNIDDYVCDHGQIVARQLTQRFFCIDNDVVTHARFEPHHPAYAVSIADCYFVIQVVASCLTIIGVIETLIVSRMNLASEKQQMLAIVWGIIFIASILLQIIPTLGPSGSFEDYECNHGPVLYYHWFYCYDGTTVERAIYKPTPLGVYLENAVRWIIHAFTASLIVFALATTIIVVNQQPKKNKI